MTRQHRWQLKQATLGRCIICGKEAKTKTYCERHRVKDLERQHARKVAKRAGGTP